ncbi:MAG: SDR family oxidoreductase, partial [Pseudomonadota bacterium]
TIDDVGKSALYLLSDLGSGVTGENLHVDAGFHANNMIPRVYMQVFAGDARPEV